MKEIDEISRGIEEIFGLRSILSQHCNDISEEFLSVYSTIKYNNNKEMKEQEEDIIYNFTNFVESLDFKNYEITIESLIPNEKQKQIQISLKDVARFCTGSYYVMESMKSKGTIKFDRPNEKSKGKKNYFPFLLLKGIQEPPNSSFETFVRTLHAHQGFEDSDFHAKIFYHWFYYSILSYHIFHFDILLLLLIFFTRI